MGLVQNGGGSTLFSVGFLIMKCALESSNDTIPLPRQSHWNHSEEYKKCLIQEHLLTTASFAEFICFRWVGGQGDL